MIAPEGFWYVLAPLLLFVGSAVFGVWRKKAWLYFSAGLFLLLLIAMLFFFRDPERPLPVNTAIVSVSDGVVDEIVRMPDGSTRIEVFLSLLNVHALHAPVSGVVTDYEYHPGSFIPAQRLESIEKNERITVDLMTQYGPVQISAISGAIARRVLLPVELGEELISGQRIGFVRFGSRSELILPPGIELEVDVGDKVYGGVTVVGTVMPEKQNPVLETGR